MFICVNCFIKIVAILAHMCSPGRAFVVGFLSILCVVMRVLSTILIIFFFFFLRHNLAKFDKKTYMCYLHEALPKLSKRLGDVQNSGLNGN